MSLRIGLVSPYDWDYTNGVREHISLLAGQLEARGHDVRILAPARNRKKSRTDDQHLYILGGSMPLHINGTLVHTACDYTLEQRVRRIFQEAHFDVVHIHEPLFPGLPLTALRASNAVTIGTFHAYAEAKNLSIPSLGYRALAPFVRSAFARLDRRIVVSSVARQFIARFFPGEYCIIPNGVDMSRFSMQKSPFLEFMDGKKNILFVGRFDQRKGAKYLIHAIPLIRATHPDTRFIFVGDGHLRPDLQKFVEKQHWSDVLFTGYVPSEILPHYFASASVFCSPATGGESMGIVLLEAMASGVPLVASAIPGYTTVIEDEKNGLLVPPNDSYGLAQAINRLLASQELLQQFRARSLEKVHHYAWPYISQRIEKCYLETLMSQGWHPYDRTLA